MQPGVQHPSGCRGEPSTHPLLEAFYSLLIFADVLVVLISLRYGASYQVVFRNSGLAVATVLLRLALTAPPPMSGLLGVVAVLYALGLTLAYNRSAPAAATTSG